MHRSIAFAAVMVAGAAIPGAASEVPFAGFDEAGGPVDGAAATAVAELDRDGDLDLVAVIRDPVRQTVGIRVSRGGQIVAPRTSGGLRFRDPGAPAAVGGS